MSESGITEQYAVLGHPIGHSLSPIMHMASFKSLGLDAVYVARDVAPEKLMESLPLMRDEGFKGVNLTVPLKEVAFKGLSADNLDAHAAMMGAVNTVQFLDDGSMKGYNTDGEGFLKAIAEAFGCSPEGKSVFIIGGGGAGRAVALMCALKNAASIVIADVDPDRTKVLCEEISNISQDIDVKGIDIDPAILEEASLAADLIIQATPVGMNPDDEPLLGASAFREGQMLFDLIYMYPQTAIMKNAAEAGAQTANGLGMLMHQGAHAFKIWTGQDADTEVMRKALEGEVYSNV
jgi:shikimate dehydrogenase